ncbi:MAG: adenylate/guanylate cyclase domain-containing protein [Candidatus Dormiibacterota bacterium]
MSCPHCGRENETTQKFCGSCGRPLLLTCPSCGNTSSLDYRFCGSCGTDLRPVPPTSHSGEERRVVTVLFADLVGFTSRAERLDPEDVRALLDPYYACLRDAIQAFGGQVEKYVGDAVMGVFGAPTAHGDDPERAVRAALRIQVALAEMNASDPRRDLQVRIAVNTGEAIVALGARTWEGEAMVAGDVVNTAARLQSSAPVNSVLVGEETYRATRFTVEYQTVDALALKGKQLPVSAWLAVSATRSPGERSVKSAALVGRRGELSALAERFDHVLGRSHAHLATVFGLPGVGKTRLATEFAAIVASKGGRTIRGRSLPYGESGAYSAFAQQIKQVAEILDSDPPAAAVDKIRRSTAALLGPQEVDEVAIPVAILLGVGPPESVADRHSLFFAARRFVEGLTAQQPTVLLFEDLQWADPSLLDLVEHLASRIREAPLMLLALARPDFLGERPNWGALLPAYLALPLEPLNVEDSAELARRLLARSAPEAEPETAIQLAATGEGNPLFIEELAASLSERTAASGQELPTSIRGIVAARLDALPASERSALLDASVIGKVFWSSALALLGDLDDRLGEALDLLEWRDMIRREPVSRIRGHEQFRFKHMVIKDVAYASLPRARRREGHAVVARFLEEVGVAHDSLAMLAYHWREAGDQEKAVHYLVAAAEQARRGWAKEEAVRYYKEALRLVPEEDAQLRRHIRLQCAVAEQMVFHVPDADSLVRGQPDLASDS